MARKYSCGFELQTITNAVEVVSTTGSPTIDTSIKRSGAASMRFNATIAEVSARITEDPGAAADQIMRAYFYFASFPLATLTKIIQLSDSGGDHTSIRVNSDGTLELWNDVGAVQLGSDSAALSLNTWYRIELASGTTHTGDDVIARIDGVDFASSTTHSAGANWRYFEVGVMGALAMDLYVDDIALNDTTGTAQTFWPGAGSIVHMHPDSAGDAAASAGTFADIDEITPDDATTIIVIDETTDIGDYNLETSANAGIGASDTITLVQVGIRFAGLSAATHTHVTRIKSQASGTVVSGTTTTGALSTYSTNDDTASARFYKLTSYVDPQAGGVWTPSLLDSAQIGVTSTDANPDVNVSTLWALVEYVPGVAGGTTITPRRMMLGVGT